MNFLRGDFRVGGWTVHPSLNSLERDRKTVHLEPKVMQVLLTLASEPSEVFTRDTVQRRVWPDVVVGEDVLVRAISKIRRAFEDESIIETVPKVGYRLVATVIRESASSSDGEADELGAPSGETWPLEESTAESHASVNPPRHEVSIGKRILILLAAAVPVLLAAFAVFRHFSQNRPSQPAASYVTRPFTTDPGSQIQASFSPDGNSVAYVWRKEGDSYGQIYIMSVNSNQPRQLSPGQPANQFNPVWSPDAGQIAFIRKDDSHSSVVVVPSSGGPAHEVYTLPVNSAREYGGLAWSADGTSLIFPQQNTLEGPSYLVELSLQDRTIRSITDPPSLWDGDFFPAVSPDGRKLAFIRGSELLARDIYVMNLPNGPVQRITYGCLVMSLAWTADSSSIVFSSSRDGTLSLWRVRAAGGQPQRMAEVGDDAYAPAIAKHGQRLIYSHGSAMWGIFSVSLEDKGASSAVILTSSEEAAAPRISPSGSRVIFQSWRSGSREIWAARMDGSNPVQLTNNPGESAGDPAWSPNGKFIAFDARLGPFAHIYVIGANGGKPETITSGSFNDVAPSWSVDGKSLFFGSNRSGSWQIWKVSIDGSHAPQQVTSNGGMVALESPNRRYLYYTKNMAPGLWRQQLAGGRERKVFDGPPADYPEFWTLSKDDIYALSVVHQHYVLSYIDSKSGRGRILDVLKYSPTVGLSISPNGKVLVYSGLIMASSHLTLVEDMH